MSNVYVELPEDVQEAIRILLIYRKLERSGNPRPLYPKAIERACRILKIQTDWTVPRGEPNRWTFPKDREVRSRLQLAGLNPDDVMRVADQDLWNLTWQQH